MLVVQLCALGEVVWRSVVKIPGDQHDVVCDDICNLYLAYEFFQRLAQTAVFSERTKHKLD